MQLINSLLFNGIPCCANVVFLDSWLLILGSRTNPPTLYPIAAQALPGLSSRLSYRFYQ